MIAAVEDTLSEAIVRRIVAAVRPDLTIWTVMGFQGYGYLRRRCRELNRTAGSVPVLLVTDQDTPANCPPALIAEWLPIPRNANLLFRVAVMEVESWVMADRAAFAGLLRIPGARIPANTDTIPNPKEFIVKLARSSRSREIKADLVPARGATTPVGPAYNARLAGFVKTSWDPEEAAKTSGSLHRAMTRLKEAFK